MKKLLLILVLLAAIVAAIPPVLGMVYERQITAEFENAPVNPVMGVELQEYQRGLYASRGAVVLAFTDEYLDRLRKEALTQRQEAEAKGQATGDAQAAIDDMLEFISGDVRLDFQVRHGPFTFGNGPAPGLAFIRATLDPQDGKLAEFQVSTGVPYLFWSEGIVGFDGTTAFTGGIPAMVSAEGESRFEFSGMQMAGRYEARARALQMEMSSDSLTVAAQGSRLGMNQLKLTADTQVLDEFIWVGDTRLDIGEIDVSVAGNESPASFMARDLGFAGTARASETGDRLDLQVQYFLGSVEGEPDTRIADLVVGVNLTNIDAQAYKRLMRQAQTMEMSTQAASEAALQTLIPILVDMLRASPGVELSPFRFTSDGQAFAAAVSLQFNADRFDDAMFAQFPQNPGLAMVALSAEGNLQAPEALLSEWVANGLRGQIEANLPPETTLTDEQLANAAAAQSAMTLESMVVQGMLEREGDVLKSEFQYADGLLTVRGNVIPLGGQ